MCTLVPVFNMLSYQYSILPRVLVDVSRVDMSTSILGYRTSSPIMLAPTGMHRLAHPEGKLIFLLFTNFSWNSLCFSFDSRLCLWLCSRGSCNSQSSSWMWHNYGMKGGMNFDLITCINSFNFLYFQALSFSSSCSLEEVASSCNATRFFQVYVFTPLISSFFSLYASFLSDRIVVELDFHIWCSFLIRRTEGAMCLLLWYKELKEMDSRL